MAARNFITVVKKCNNFLIQGSYKQNCLPFYVGDKQVGIVRRDILCHLQKYKDVFIASSSKLKLSDDLRTFKERSDAVHEVLKDLREQNVLDTLNGWRNETIDIRSSPREDPILKVERSGACLFGVIVYSVHINGYTTKDNQLMMWLGRRSNSRPTYPNMLDNMCAGGLTSGQSVKQCAIKECAEEASVPKKLTDKLKAVGCVSHIFEDQRGVFPVCEYVFDLHLPSNYEPVNADGEVGSFEMITIEKIMDNIVLEDFRPSSAMIALDFLIRHGFVSPENVQPCSI